MSGIRSAARPFLGRGPTGFFVFTLLNAAQRLIGLLVLPLVADDLPVAEYGQIAVITTIAALSGILLSLGLESWVFRAHFAYETDVGKSYLAVVGALLRIMGPIVGLVGAAGLWLASVTASPGSSFLVALALAILATGLQASVGPYAQASLRARQRFGRFASIALAFTSVAGVAKLILVGQLGLGLEGWFIADLLAALVAYLAALALVPLPAPLLRMHVRAGLRQSLVFGLPLIPHVALFSLLGQGDRLVLAGLVSDAELGRYAIAYQAMFVFGILALEFTRAAGPSYARHSTSVNEDALQRLIMQHQSVSLGLATIGLVVTPIAVALLLPASYAAPVSVYPWLALGVVFMGLYTIPTGLLILVQGRPRRVWQATGAGVAVNFAGVAVLAPPFGITGAASATAFGYFVMAAALVAIEAREQGLLSRVLPRGRLLLPPTVALVAFLLAAVASSSASDPARYAVGSIATCLASVAVMDARRRGVAPRAHAGSAA